MGNLISLSLAGMKYLLLLSSIVFNEGYSTFLSLTVTVAALICGSLSKHNSITKCINMYNFLKNFQKGLKIPQG